MGIRQPSVFPQESRDGIWKTSGPEEQTDGHWCGSNMPEERVEKTGDALVHLSAIITPNSPRISLPWGRGVRFSLSSESYPGHGDTPTAQVTTANTKPNSMYGLFSLDNLAVQASVVNSGVILGAILYHCDRSCLDAVFRGKYLGSTRLLHRDFVGANRHWPMGCRCHYSHLEHYLDVDGMLVNLSCRETAT